MILKPHPWHTAKTASLFSLQLTLSKDNLQAPLYDLDICCWNALALKPRLYVSVTRRRELLHKLNRIYTPVYYTELRHKDGIETFLLYRLVPVTTMNSHKILDQIGIVITGHL